jgi:hypothetical protein
MFDNTGEITPLTQKVILAVWRRTTVLRGARCDWDAMANGNCAVRDRNVFDHEPYDSLALNDTKHFRSSTQASEECCECLRQA